MILLFFFLGGKRASCDYGPNARTLKNIRLKQRIVPDNIIQSLQQFQLDTSAIGYLLNNGTVDFKNSNTRLDSCRIYVIEGQYNDFELGLTVENCDKQARIKNVEITPPSYSTH